MANAVLIETLFARFDETLATNGYSARGGQIIHATIVAVPKQRNDRGENKNIKGGEVPAAWKTEPNKLAQKDCDARWTNKHGRRYFGYKNHINVDAKYKLIQHYGVSDANVHDSREFSRLLDNSNISCNVFADSAYRSAGIEAELKVQGLKTRIDRRAARSHPLSAVKEKANRKRSQVRARIEHVFGALNLVYNICRMVSSSETQPPHEATPYLTRKRCIRCVQNRPLPPIVPVIASRDQFFKVPSKKDKDSVYGRKDQELIWI